MIAVRHAGGVHLPGPDLWLDPRRSKPLAFVSHAHSDHTGRHAQTLATPATLRLMEARMGKLHGTKIPIPFNETRAFDQFTIRLLPAGHVLGSAQSLIETAKGTLLYTGDFKLRQGASAEPTAHAHAGTLVMETTYGLPRYIFPPFEQVLAQILKFCIEALEEHTVPVLLGYSLGKAQEILACLRGADLKVMLHTSIAQLIPVYESEGISFPDFSVWNPQNATGHVVICPPAAARSRAMATISNRRVAAVTGWAMDAGAIHRMRCNAAFPLSDHAGYDDLLRHVENVNPNRVLTLHGYASEFAADLRARGIEAWALTGPNQLDLALPIPSKVVSPGASVPPPAGDCGFLQFCAVAAKIADLTGKTTKIELLADYFRSLPDPDLQYAAAWLSGRAFPAPDADPHQADPAIVRAALVQASGMPDRELRRLARGLNDMALTAETALSASAGTHNPSLLDMAALLQKIRATRSGLGKADLLAAFFRESPASAAKFLVKILAGNLRIGLKHALVEEALALTTGIQAHPAESLEANKPTGEPGQLSFFSSHFPEGM